MNNLNFDLQLQLSDYLYNTNILSWITLFKLDKNLYPAMLYTLRKKRNTNTMTYDFKYHYPTYASNIYKMNNEYLESYVLNLANKNLYNNLFYVIQNNLLPKGNYIRAINRASKNNNLDIVKLLIPFDTNNDYNIDDAVVLGHIQVVKFLLRNMFKKYNQRIKSSTPVMLRKFLPSWVLEKATRYNQTEMVKLLLPYSYDVCTLSLYAAIYNNNLELAKILIPYFGDLDYNDYINQLVDKGHTEMIKLLAPLSTKKQYYHAISQAAQKGYYDILEILLPLNNGVKDYSYPKSLAKIQGYSNIIDLLNKY